MAPDAPTNETPGAPQQSHAVLWILIAMCVSVEFALSASDWGWIGISRLRQTAYEWGGFWPGLLQGWQPNFTGQPIAMFATYGFLHGGLEHLVVNMITLWSLGRAVLNRVGLKGFVVLYFGALIGGAIGFGILVESFRPMVGASGALFGLAGGLLAWDYVDRYTFRDRLWPVARLVLFLVAMNVAMWWALDGQLAWETHLGGFVVGWIMALLIDPRGRSPADLDQ
ncbi:rhomboid family intramembrane serine protease [Gymnodinialimonas sp. 2305UL16-5]|uniref:rhomboid family intramembrane serine protease n=1 Tax=Gymnodinialimonas mytili TaxID=3126503 RepID=UPI00309E36CD